MDVLREHRIIALRRDQGKITVTPRVGMGAVILYSKCIASLLVEVGRHRVFLREISLYFLDLEDFFFWCE